MMDNARELERFLLGDLPEDQQEALESRLLEDTELWEEIRAVEEELLDALVRDELPAEDQQRLLERCAHQPDLAERLTFAKTLQKLEGAAETAGDPLPSNEEIEPIATMPEASAPTPRRRTPRWVPALAAAALLMIGVRVWDLTRQEPIKVPEVTLRGPTELPLPKSRGVVPIDFPNKSSARGRLEGLLRAASADLGKVQCRGRGKKIRCKLRAEQLCDHASSGNLEVENVTITLGCPPF